MRRCPRHRQRQRAAAQWRRSAAARSSSKGDSTALERRIAARSERRSRAARPAESVGSAPRITRGYAKRPACRGYSLEDAQSGATPRPACFPSRPRHNRTLCLLRWAGCAPLVGRRGAALRRERLASCRRRRPERHRAGAEQCVRRRHRAHDGRVVTKRGAERQEGAEGTCPPAPTLSGSAWFGPLPGPLPNQASARQCPHRRAAWLTRTGRPRT